MKKRILGVAIIAAVAVAAGWNFNQSKNEVKISNLILANVDALANDSEHGAGDVANKYCPIWNVSYSESWSGTEISCSTGGSYKCAKGSCPHE